MSNLTESWQSNALERERCVLILGAGIVVGFIAASIILSSLVRATEIEFTPDGQQLGAVVDSTGKIQFLNLEQVRHDWKRSAWVGDGFATELTQRRKARKGRTTFAPLRETLNPGLFLSKQFVLPAEKGVTT